jgi:hypothetical protein
MAMLFQVNIEQVNGAAETEDGEGEHCKDRPDAAAPWVRIPVHNGGPEFIDPLFFISVPIEWGLNAACNVLRSLPTQQPERLLGGGTGKSISAVPSTRTLCESQT